MRGLIASIVDQIDDCEVIEVDGGYQALKELPRDVFDLIVTDINMPDINGFELLAFIRRNPNYAATPVLIVTSEESESERKKGLALGANAILSKPFEERELLETVRNLLDGGAAES